ncbi:LOW QUALITY PROTEIN: Rit1, N-terminal domain [Dillenia turbinata]|uniref:Rit1, N-terminal domain n=1 Tax=Dillenia turbinata TaxID=194707 RepID=A0AAN8W921_9MAGN
MEDGKLSIYKIARTIKENETRCTIHCDQYTKTRYLRNLSNMARTSSSGQSPMRFLSTDGHQNNWSFNILVSTSMSPILLTFRAFALVVSLLRKKGGCIIVDSTRKGKRFPDSSSKTIPIWCCVFNRAIRNYLIRLHVNRIGGEGVNICDQKAETVGHNNSDWHHSLHLPLWLPKTEKASIEHHLEQWTNELETSGADIASLAASLKKAFTPLWISQKSLIWLNEESWLRGLSPILFWSHEYDIITGGLNLCNQKVAIIIERDRIYRALRGQDAPQVTVMPPKLSGSSGHFSNVELKLYSEIPDFDMKPNFSIGGCGIAWLGSTYLGVEASRLGIIIVGYSSCLVSTDDSILNCDSELVFTSPWNDEEHLHLPIVVSEDISISVLLAIFTSVFNDEGLQDPLTMGDPSTRLILPSWRCEICDKCPTLPRKSEAGVQLP